MQQKQSAAWQTHIHVAVAGKQAALHWCGLTCEQLGTYAWQKQLASWQACKVVLQQQAACCPLHNMSNVWQLLWCQHAVLRTCNRAGQLTALPADHSGFNGPPAALHLSTPKAVTTACPAKQCAGQDSRADTGLTSLRRSGTSECCTPPWPSPTQRPQCRSRALCSARSSTM